MVDLAKFFIQMILKSSLFFAMVFAFIVFLNFALSLTLVGLNSNVLTDLFALVQMWLPFNLNVLLTWLFTVTSLYFVYRLANVGLAFINELFR